MSIAKFSVGRSGAGGANAEYITRERAAESITFRNLEDLQTDDWREARVNAIAYAYTCEDVELAHSGKARTHYRLILSWDRKETSEQAAAETEKFLAEVLPQARAIIAVHQDTEHTHAHVWIDARQTDEKKIHLSRQEFRSFDERWARQFDESYGTEYAAAYLEKKTETTNWRRKEALKQERREELREAGRPVTPIDAIRLRPRPKPERAADGFDLQHWRDKEKERLGGAARDHDQDGLGANQPSAQNGDRPLAGAERFVNATERTASGSPEPGAGRSAGLARAGGADGGTLPESGTALAATGAVGNNAGGDADETYAHHVSFLLRSGDAVPSATQPSGPEVSGKGLYQVRPAAVRATEGESVDDVPGGASGLRAFTTRPLNIVPLPELPPPVELYAPQMVPNVEMFVADIERMMRESLAEQGRRMTDEAREVYHGHLQAVAYQPPTPAQVNLVAQHNERTEDEARKIDLADKSRLEAIHDILSHADVKERGEICDATARLMEKEADRRAAQQEDLFEERGFSMSR